MANLLKTQLRDIVPDKNLPILGGLELPLVGCEGYFYLTGVGCTFRRYDTGGTLVQTTTDNFNGQNLPAGKIRVDNKYALTQIYCTNLSASNINLDELQYSTGITELKAKVSGDIAKLASLTGLVSATLIPSGTLTGDISVFANMPSLSSISLNENTIVYGDVSVFASKALTGVTLQSKGIVCDVAHFGKSISATELWLNKSSIGGTIEDLADAQIAEGRTSGTLRVYGNDIITYNGMSFSGSKLITFSGGTYTIS